jgi:SlyX protein
MNETDLTGRLEALEVRYAHQEAALEELTRTVLAQEQLIRLQAEQLGPLQHSVRAMLGGAADAVADERPPHY